MSTLFSIDANLSKLLYEALGGRPYQEKGDRILEPLQVMIQLSLLSFCPVGTKLCINNNILSLQLPTLSQGIWRWFNKDSKEDLYFLFNAVKRFYIWYKDNPDPFYEYILSLAKKGLTKLITTYKKTDNTSVTHALTLYKTILEMNNAEVFGNEMQDSTTIDKVFQRIKKLYDKKLLLVIINILKLMEEEKEVNFRNEYYEGLQTILGLLHNKIQKWIHKELLCT